jgi:uncharacterized protein YbjT (DUF2867 family)
MKSILLTGATGYVGGKLLGRLQQRGLAVTCFARRPAALNDRVDARTTVVQGDVQNLDEVSRALNGIDTAFYLIHSMGAKEGFEEEDRRAAQTFASAARINHVNRIIYLGGLGHAAQELSTHLKSRQEVGEILTTSGAQVLEFRASVVIGSGSLSFEMIRSLVNRLPVLIIPKWGQVHTQPISIDDLLSYLEEAIDWKGSGNEIFEIGGADIVPYRALMEEYARQRGLDRILIDVPVLTPWLSGLWLGLVTPVLARTGRRLADSLSNPTVVTDNRAEELFQVRPVGLKEAIRRAIKNGE